MKIALLIHSLVEIIGAIILLLYPDFLSLQNMNIAGYQLIRMYSIIALAFGLVSIVLYANFNYTIGMKAQYLIILGFHIFISFHLFSLYQSRVLDGVEPLLAHILLVGILFVGYFKDIQKFKESI